MKNWKNGRPFQNGRPYQIFNNLTFNLCPIHIMVYSQHIYTSLLGYSSQYTYICVDDIQLLPNTG